jgi:superfamily I DNA/RNA helicase
MYEALIKNDGKADKVSLTDLVGIDSVPELIDNALTRHGFDLSAEESAVALSCLGDMAEDFKGDLSAFLDTLSLERGLDHTDLAGERLALMSLHRAKGLEWPVVFITGCEDKLIPCSLFGSRDDNEEKRLFYVGMTRAKSRLILSHVKRRSLNGRVLDMAPSPFLHAVPEILWRPLDRASWRTGKRAQEQLSLFEPG